MKCFSPACESSWKHRTVIITLLVGLGYFLPANIGIAQTYVSGIIWADTTWDIAGSPYYVIGDVQVPSGVTLTIERGVTMQYMGDYELLVKGYLNAQGSSTDSIRLVGGGTKLKFVGANLDSSHVSYVNMSGGRAIMVGSGGGEFNSGEPCTGTLIVSHITIEGAEVRTGGYQTSAALVLDDAVLRSVTVIGQYPRSEPISIMNATVTNCNIISDSYNYGITLENAVVTNSRFAIGCCGGNLRLRGCTVLSSSIGEGSGSPVTWPLEMTNSRLIATPISLPAATVLVTNSIIDYKASTGLQFGNGSIIQSTVIGTDAGVGVEITGYEGYNIGGSITLSHATIVHNTVGVRVARANTMTVQGSNFIDNTTYNLENRSATTISASNNFWGTTDSTQIVDKIFDYNDDINYGLVQLQNNLTSPDTVAPVSPPMNVAKTAVPGGVELRWSANKESDIAGYKVYYGSSTGYSFAHVVDVGNVTSYELPGAALTDTVAVTAYDIHADGKNDQMEGHESWFAISHDYSTPAVPLLLYPANNATVLSLEPTLIWAHSNGSEKYRLQLATDSLFGSILYDFPELTDPSQKVGPLESHTTYYWRVQASNLNGSSAYSSARSFSTIDTATSLWSVLNSNTMNNLYAIFPINENLAVTVGDEGIIMLTSDGGNTWSKLNSGTTKTLYSVYFTDSLKGWAIGSGGIILNTTDKGTTWNIQNSGTDKPLYSVFFQNDSVGTIVGVDETILTTTNGGQTWQMQSTSSARPGFSGIPSDANPQTDCLLNVIFVNSMRGYAVGGHGKLLLTTDGGKAWVAQTSGTTNDLWAIAFADAQTGVAVGAFGTIIRTTDGGTSWSPVRAATTNHLNAVHFIDATTGIAVGAKGTGLRTTDGGLTWREEIAGDANWLRGVATYSTGRNIIVGSNGLILIPSSKATAVKDGLLSGVPKTFKLYQNYPNPFNPSTNIRYEVPVQTKVTLTIFNVLGQEVTMLVNETKQPGRYEVKWDPIGQASGTYLYRIIAGDFIETKKMILLR